MNLLEAKKPDATVLIIDDDRARDEVYEAFFALLTNHKNFVYRIRPFIASTPSAAIKYLLAREPCLVVLDMMLDGIWGEQSDLIYEAMSRTQCPMGLLSLDFNDGAASKSANKVLAKLRSVPKLGFWPYATAIERYCKGPYASQAPVQLLDDPVSVWNLAFQEAQGHGKHWQPHSPGEITFLHLTDTHFGKSKPDYLEAFAVSNGAKGRNNSGGVPALVADYLIWTGDITNRGLPSEYSEARQFAKDIRTAELIPMSCPISIVPGNHDLCWPLALSSRLSLEDIDKAEKVTLPAFVGGRTEDTTPKHWVVKDVSVNHEIWTFGTQPFRDFYTDLVGEPAPSMEVGFRLHTQWAHLGFAVFELPIEAHVVQSNTLSARPPPFVSDLEFKNITNAAIKAFQDSTLEMDVCVIFLIHGRAPDQPESGAERWSELVDRIEEIGHATLIFGGHEHAATHLAVGRRLTIIGAPHDKRNTYGSQTLPGVGFIRLFGLGTKRLRCEITKVQQGTGDTAPSKWVQLLPPQRFEIATAKPHPWVNVTVFSDVP